MKNKNNQSENRTNGKKLLSRREVADRWGVSTETVKRRQLDGSLPAVVFNSRLIRYVESDVEKFEANSRLITTQAA